MADDQKPIISEKTKKLAAEIKFVNTMKLSDVEKWLTANHRTASDSATIVAPPKDLNSSTVTPSPAIPKNRINNCSPINQVPIGDMNEECPTTTANNAVNMPDPEEDTPSAETKLNDTIVPETPTPEEPPKDTTNGHEEALETEPIGSKPVHGPTKDEEIHKEEEEEEDDDDHVGGAKLQDYVSPLSHLRDERQINPNGIVCPYQLMGQCDDKDCKYMHLDECDRGSAKADDDNDSVNYDNYEEKQQQVEQNNKEMA